MGTDILLAAPHAFIRSALKQLIETRDGLRVVREVDGARPLCLHVTDCRCDLVLLDYELPNASAAAVIAEVKRARPGLPLAVMSMRSDVLAVAQALAAGADGYLVKSQPADEALDALQIIARGDPYLAPGIERAAVERATAALRDGVVTHGPLAGLSRREREIFELMARGYSGRHIAANLFISPRTVDTHRTHIFHKLAVHSEVELLRFAVRHQLVQPERLDGDGRAERSLPAPALAPLATVPATVANATASMRPAAAFAGSPAVARR